MTYASSAFFKIGKKRKNIAKFLSTVFAAYSPVMMDSCIRRCLGRKDSLIRLENNK